MISGKKFKEIHETDEFFILFSSDKKIENIKTDWTNFKQKTIEEIETNDGEIVIKPIEYISDDMMHGGIIFYTYDAMLCMLEKSVFIQKIKIPDDANVVNKKNCINFDGYTTDKIIYTDEINYIKDLEMWKDPIFCKWLKRNYVCSEKYFQCDIKK